MIAAQLHHLQRHQQQPHQHQQQQPHQHQQQQLWAVAWCVKQTLSFIARTNLQSIGEIDALLLLLLLLLQLVCCAVSDAFDAGVCCSCSCGRCCHNVLFYNMVAKTIATATTTKDSSDSSDSSYSKQEQKQEQKQQQQQ